VQRHGARSVDGHVPLRERQPENLRRAVRRRRRRLRRRDLRLLLRPAARVLFGQHAGVCRQSLCGGRQRHRERGPRRGRDHGEATLESVFGRRARDAVPLLRRRPRRKRRRARRPLRARPQRGPGLRLQRLQHDFPRARRRRPQPRLLPNQRKERLGGGPAHRAHAVDRSQ
jgi:hypothetical protein